MLKHALVLAAVAALTRGALAQLSYVEQNRSVTAIGPGGGPTNTQSAANFDFFSVSVGSPGPAGGTALASQASELLPLRITAFGTAQRGKNVTNQFGQASSTFYAKFTSLNNSPFTFTSNSSFASGSITGPGVNILLFGAANGQGTFLAGGTYEVSISTAGAVQAGSSVQGIYDLVINLTGINAADQSRGLTYQGVLKGDTGPLDGAADIRYTLYPAATGPFAIGTPLEFPATTVQKGVFGHRLDFGDVFDGKERWLEVEVRTPPGAGTYTAIGPRTRIDSTPYASYALQSGGAPWAGLTGVPSNVANAFSPWQSVAGGIAYTGRAAIGNADVTTDDNLAIGASGPARVLVQSDSNTFAGYRAKNASAEYFTGVNNTTEWHLFDNVALLPRLRLRNNGNIGIGNIAAEQKLSVDGTVQIVTGTSSAPTFLAFGAVGNTLGTAESTDLVAFQRVNISSAPANATELRLILGDDNTTSPSMDFFTIGTIPGGNWNPTFGFRSDGFASKPGGGSWGTISDPRTKHDVSPLKGTLDRLLSLRGYQYHYNDAEVKKGRALPGLQIGLMADEVERVFPDWVSRDTDGMRMVTERSTTALMVEALRDLRAEKDEQIKQRDETIQSQGREIEDLKARLARIEEMLKSR